MSQIQVRPFKLLGGGRSFFFYVGFILFLTNTALLTVVSPPVECLLLGWATLFLICLFSAQEGSPGYPQEHKFVQGYKRNTNARVREMTRAVYNPTFKRKNGTDAQEVACKHKHPIAAVGLSKHSMCCPIIWKQSEIFSRGE